MTRAALRRRQTPLVQQPIEGVPQLCLQLVPDDLVVTRRVTSDLQRAMRLLVARRYLVRRAERSLRHAMAKVHD